MVSPGRISADPNSEATDAAYPSWIAHIALAVLLVGLIGLHLLAALCHQLVRKDRLFRRMPLGRDLSNPAVAAKEVLDIYP
jgi:cytochrome b561